MSKKWIYLISFILVSALTISVSEGADPSLVGWWRFEEGSGTTAYDSSGNGLDGNLVGGATWTQGRIGGGLELDGTSGYVSVPDFELTTDSITFVIWLNGWKGGDWAPLLSSREVGDCEMIFGDDDTLRYVWNNDSSATWGWTDGPVIPEDTWTMLAVTIDPDQAVAYVYTDDGGLTQSTNAIAHIEETVGALQIGYSYDPRYIRGIIDEAAVFNRALTEQEILGLVSGLGEGYPYSSGPSPNDGTLVLDTWVNLSWRAGDFAVSHDVYIGDNFDDVDTGDEGAFIGNQTDTFIVAGFPGFPYPDGLIPGTTYYWRIDEVNDAEPNSPWKGDVWSFSIPPKTAYFPDPADGSESVSIDAELSWTAGFGAKLHTPYFGETFDEVDTATGGMAQGTTTYSPGTLKMARTCYWRIDEFDITETHKGDVWSFTTEGAVAALDPANGAVDVTQTPVLTWAPGLGASHEVYFGADAASLELKSSGNLGSESYEPGQLEWDTTYYWRVDEVNNANADSPWTGPLWSFTTANFLIVDDFESYNDLDPAEPGSNRIFLAWIDGFDNPAVNGSVVGYANPPFAEQTIVNSGSQSMPFVYDNAVGKSEATLTLSSNRDWTVKGVNRLTIWHRGSSSNAAEQMYVILNGSAGVDNDNPDAAQSSGWTEWNIDLQAFADQGVNLSSVNSITLGLGNRANPVAGGSGMLYFDDIRLYAP
ncbi:MAG: LamG domain-containing protein [Planctomycetes bacterium]|nr:LamG domain-containing protein [Planctomycetota bacterium]